MAGENKCFSLVRGRAMRVTKLVIGAAPAMRLGARCFDVRVIAPSRREYLLRSCHDVDLSK